jgi:hypothetical protein
MVCDPYFSIWSAHDTLHGGQTQHWTGVDHPLVCLIRIDGAAFRLVGARPGGLPALEQTGLRVQATRTVATFEGCGVAVELEFTTPALPDDLDLLSRPVTYLVWRIRSTDGRDHAVSVYFEVWPEVAVNSPDQKVVWSRPQVDGLTVLSVGTAQQVELGSAGDDQRIDWGWFYLASDDAAAASLVTHKQAHAAFINRGVLPTEDVLEMPLAPVDWRNVATLGMLLDFGAVGAQPTERRIVAAYDDRFSIEFLRRKLRPYWRRTGWNAGDLLKRSFAEAETVLARCRAFDAQLERELTEAGGAEYAALCELSFRQCLAAHKLVADADGCPLLFSKENFSNGCIATVDVTYPALPFYAGFNPALLEAAIRPICVYAATPAWRFPFAPHDLGVYPLANGQVYGGGERDESEQMPVEECGNMLLLAAVLVRQSGSDAFVREFWPLFERWAAYLAEKGFDPDNQLCTDDFAGMLAHNTNLSIKAILALGAFAQLCEQQQLPAEAARYLALARDFAARWMAAAEDGDHARLAFDRPGTWSQKYNLVCDRLLGLHLFPESLASREMAFYKTKLQEFGLPLDNRSDVAKLDWHLWTAALAESSEEWQALLAPLYHWVNTTVGRVPLSDRYPAGRPVHRGYRARSVVGGVFMKWLFVQNGVSTPFGAVSK